MLHLLNNFLNIEMALKVFFSIFAIATLIFSIQAALIHSPPSENPGNYLNLLSLNPII